MDTFKEKIMIKGRYQWLIPQALIITEWQCTLKKVSLTFIPKLKNGRQVLTETVDKPLILIARKICLLLQLLKIQITFFSYKHMVCQSNTIHTFQYYCRRAKSRSTFCTCHFDFKTNKKAHGIYLVLKEIWLIVIARTIAYVETLCHVTQTIALGTQNSIFAVPIINIMKSSQYQLRTSSMLPVSPRSKRP